MFFWDMLSQSCDEIKYRNCLCNKFIIFMAIVMKGNEITIIGINAGSCNDRSAEITTDIFDYLRRIAFIRHSTNIKTVFMFCIDGSF